MARTYDRDFKISAVLLVKEGKSSAQVCRDLNIPESTFSGWLKEYSKEGEEIRTLKKQLEDVRLERDILKKALAIFS